MSNPATRLIQLIMLLQARPNRKAVHLAAELGISVRTLHRYIAMLDEMGIPIYSERGPHGGFSLVRGYKMPPLVLTPDESAAVCLGTDLVEQMWGTLYRDAARSALAKLENLLPDEQREQVAWARRALWSTGLHRADPAALAPVLETLRRAAREHRRVRMVYRGQARAEPSRREVATYALVHRSGWWYVVGHCYMRNDVRCFRVDRIAELELLQATFDVPPGFDPRAHLLGEAAGQPQVMLRMRFDREMAHVARANRLSWTLLDEAPNGSVTVELAVPDLVWAASTALSFGPMVEILQPVQARRMVREWAATIADRYADDPRDDSSVAGEPAEMENE